MDSFLIKLQDEYGFHPVSAADRTLFTEYQQDNCFFDLSFTNFWSYDVSFHYIFQIIDENIVVIYRGLQSILSCILLPKPEHDIRVTVETLFDIFYKEHQQLVFEYIPEQWLPLFKDLNAVIEVSSDRKWSDYIYDTSQFVDLRGKVNKNKRHELTAFSESGAGSFQILTKENAGDCLTVFRDWCNGHHCSDCVFGCERKVFERFMKIYGDKHYCGGLIYHDGYPMAFAVAEEIGKNCACYFFQKNSERIPGLTYFLHYHCAQLHPQLPYMNWCEDMGLEGLRLNKLKYRPCAILNKYTVKLISLQTAVKVCRTGVDDNKEAFSW